MRMGVHERARAEDVRARHLDNDGLASRKVDVGLLRLGAVPVRLTRDPQVAPSLGVRNVPAIVLLGAPGQSGLQAFEERR